LRRVKVVKVSMKPQLFLMCYMVTDFGSKSLWNI
jgi:hypothetical protein